jgi:hypothetical protein
VAREASRFLEVVSAVVGLDLGSDALDEAAVPASDVPNVEAM